MAKKRYGQHDRNHASSPHHRSANTCLYRENTEKTVIGKRNGSSIHCLTVFLLFYILIPDKVKIPGPAVLCIPGSGMTKENLIGEVSANNMRAAMALNIAKQGYISVAVDNAAAGEAADLEPLTGTSYDYDTPSRILLELGWSYLGYTFFSK